MLLAAVFGLAVSGNALAASVEAKFNAGFSPKALSKSQQTPVSLHTTMKFETNDGSEPPALRQFEIDLDRHARLSLKDIPVCHPGKPDEEPLPQRCRDALIGTGKMDTQLHFPETTMGMLHSEVGIYNAGVRNGARNLLAVTNVNVPTPTEIVITIVVERDHGRYGLKLVGAVPKIAGGAGSITRLALRFHKEALSATCADRHLQTGFGATFVDGAHLSGSVLRTCTSSH